MEYEGNPKHKEPWQRGQRGSLCPKEVTAELAQQLLDDAQVDGEARYAVHEGRAFVARRHDRTADRWHGYPVAWKEVPTKIWRSWIADGKLRKSHVKKYWTEVS